MVCSDCVYAALSVYVYMISHILSKPMHMVVVKHVLEPTSTAGGRSNRSNDSSPATKTRERYWKLRLEVAVDRSAAGNKMN